MYYFDNAATTFPKPEEVYAKMDNFYRNYGVNVGRGQFKEASTANKLLEDTRMMMLDLVCANSCYDCVFTSSATEAMNVILQGIQWSKDMNVYITPFEHNAILRTLHYLKNKYEINVITLYPDKETLEYDFDNIKNQFEKSKPNVVVMTHASNSFGNINPIERIFQLAKSYDALTVCDMAQTMGLLDFNIVSSKADYVVFAGHKTLYGPLGIGGYITNKGLSLSPLIYGGTGLESQNLNMPEVMPTKYEAGSHNIQAVSGLYASLLWIKKIGISNIRKKEKETTEKLLSILNNYTNIEIIRGNNEDNNIGVVSCLFDGYSSDSIGQVLSDNDIAVRTGLHCAPNAHKFMDTFPAGTVRFSISYFTTDEDLSALDDVLEYIEINS